MKKTLSTLVILSVLPLCVGAQATSMTLVPTASPLDPAVERIILDSPSAHEIRRLSIAESKELLQSTEGPVWRVLGINASNCETPVKASEKKKCQQIKVDCSNADKFAHVFGKHATCSALYTETEVLLVNDSTGGESAKSLGASKKKAEQPLAVKRNHKKSRKAAEPVCKP